MSAITCRERSDIARLIASARPAAPSPVIAASKPVGLLKDHQSCRLLPGEIQQGDRRREEGLAVLGFPALDKLLDPARQRKTDLLGFPLRENRTEETRLAKIAPKKFRHHIPRSDPPAIAPDRRPAGKAPGGKAWPVP